MKTVAGFPFWHVEFDDAGKTIDPNSDSAMIAGVASAGITDLFIFSHGWNNDRATATRMYEGFFGEVRKLISRQTTRTVRPSVIGAIGVYWPSIAWPDEIGSDGTGGAASVADRTGLPPAIQLSMVFPHAMPARVAEVRKLLAGPPSSANLGKVRALLNELAARPARSSKHDSLEASAFSAAKFDDGTLLALAGNEGGLAGEGGAAGLGGDLAKLWDGAKASLRLASYWQMKDRAGIVGKSGLAPLIERLAKGAPTARLHLIGHSFGARLVSFGLSGLTGSGTASNLKSLLLIQGAFSHFAFAKELPFDRTRSGDLKGMDARVDGPLVTTYSTFDLAVGRSYPLASIVARQDSSATEDVVSRWGAMGSDGAQGVNAFASNLEVAGHPYGFLKHRWYNLNGASVIKIGDPPSGAHSDIIHPEIAWATLSAAAIV